MRWIRKHGNSDAIYMKKPTLLAIAFVIFAVIPVAAQSSPDAEINEVRTKMVSAIGQRNFSEAARIAQKLLKLSEKKFGRTSLQVAEAYSVLGTLQKAKGKTDDAVESLESAVKIYTALSAPPSDDLKRTYEALAQAYYLNNKIPESRRSFEKAVEIGIKLYGDSSMEIYDSSLSLGQLYAKDGLFDLADRYFLMASSVAFRNDEKEKLENVDDDRMCMVGVHIRDGNTRYRKLRSEISNLLGVHGEILNGRAVHLDEPLYPATAMGLAGTVVVRIFIDASGSVVRAKAICGNILFTGESERAAKRSKFLPTTLDGKPVAVPGYIIYNFVKR